MISSSSVRQIKCILKEHGLQFIKITEDVTEKLYQLRTAHPNVVYFIENEYLDVGGDFKAILVYHFKQYEIHNTEPSIAGIRKWLQSDRDCNICYEYNRECAQCAQCGFRYCPFCVIKIILGDDKCEPLLKHLNNINFAESYAMDLGMKCPQCNGGNTIDLLQLYFRVIHKLDGFTNQQKTIIRHIAHNDPHFETKMKIRKMSLQSLEEKNGASNSNSEIEKKDNKNQASPKDIKKDKKQKKKVKRSKASKQKQTGWNKGFLL